MNERSGGLWPLWLYPALCIAGIAALGTVLAFGDPETHRRTGLGTSWLIALVVATLPSYGVAIGFLDKRLVRLPLRHVWLVAVVSALGTPVLLTFGMLAASHFRSDGIAMAAVLLAPMAGVALGYLTTGALPDVGAQAV